MSLMMWHTTCIWITPDSLLKMWTKLVHPLSIRTTCTSCQSLVFTSNSQDRHQELILLVHGVDHHHPDFTILRSPVASTLWSTISCEHVWIFTRTTLHNPGSTLALTHRSLIPCELVLSSVLIGSRSSRVAVCVSWSQSPCDTYTTIKCLTRRG